jgi:hypothetical protein
VSGRSQAVGSHTSSKSRIFSSGSLLTGGSSSRSGSLAGHTAVGDSNSVMGGMHRHGRTSYSDGRIVNGSSVG